MKRVSRKIYRALRSNNYAVQVVVKGKPRLISFIQCSRLSGELSMFITDDPYVQEALENSSKFNKDFYMEKQFNYEAEEKSVPPTAVETVAPPTTEAGPAEERPMSPEEGITNAAAAKAYLLDKFENDKQNIVNLKRADEVRAYATERGIVFPNWE